MNPSDTCNPNPLRTHATPPSVPRVLPAHGTTQILFGKLWRKGHQTMIGTEMYRPFIGIFGFIWVLIFMSRPGFCFFQSWMADFLKTCQPCLQTCEFPRAKNHTKPVIALSLPRSKYEIIVEVRFLASQCCKQGVQIRSLTPHVDIDMCWLLKAFWVHPTCGMALDQVIVTLDSIKVRMCDATVVYVPSDWNISSKS